MSEDNSRTNKRNARYRDPNNLPSPVITPGSSKSSKSSSTSTPSTPRSNSFNPLLNNLNINYSTPSPLSNPYGQRFQSPSPIPFPYRGPIQKQTVQRPLAPHFLEGHYGGVTYHGGGYYEGEHQGYQGGSYNHGQSSQVHGRLSQGYSSQSSQESKYISVEEEPLQQHRPTSEQPFDSQLDEDEESDPERYMQDGVQLPPSPWNATQPTAPNEDMVQESSGESDDVEDEVDVVEERQKRKKIPVKDKAAAAGRAQSYSMTEDVTLTNLWLEHSEDAIHGTEQGRQKYWKKIAERFAELSNVCSRTEKSLSMRWSTLGKMYTKFSHELCKVEQQAPSGRTSACKEQLACTEFYQIHRKEFKHVVICREVFKHARWKQSKCAIDEKVAREKAQKRPTATRGDDAAAEDDASPFDVDGHTILRRPDGRAPEKERRKAAIQNQTQIQNTSSNLNVYLGQQSSRNEKRDVEIDSRLHWYQNNQRTSDSIAASSESIAASVNVMAEIARAAHHNTKIQNLQRIIDTQPSPNCTAEELAKLNHLHNIAIDKMGEELLKEM